MNPQELEVLTRKLDRIGPEERFDLVSGAFAEAHGYLLPGVRRSHPGAREAALSASSGRRATPRASLLEPVGTTPNAWPQVPAPHAHRRETTPFRYLDNTVPEPLHWGQVTALLPSLTVPLPKHFGQVFSRGSPSGHPAIVPSLLPARPLVVVRTGRLPLPALRSPPRSNPL